MSTIQLKNAPLAPDSSPALDASAANPAIFLQTFPHSEIELARIALKAQTGKDLAFTSPKGAVKFRASGGAHASAGVYLEGSAITKALDLKDLALSMPAGGDYHYTVISCGFDAAASANGSVALGAGPTVSLGLDATGGFKSAVIARVNQGQFLTGLSELENVANRWRFPSHVKTAADLAVGTTVVATVRGSIAAKFGVQYGLDYNWLRKMKMDKLAGDIGLRLHLGIAAALGFTASGAYIAAVSRERDAEVVRVQLHRDSQRGFSFAVNAGVDVHADSGPLPKHADDFIMAVFGLHGCQAFQDLHVMDQWTDKDKTPGGILTDAGLDRSLKLLRDVTGIDPQTNFAQSREVVRSVLDQWRRLDHAVASQLMKFLSEGEDLTDVKQAATVLRDGDHGEFQEFLTDKLQDVKFFQQPVGKFLEAAAPKGLLALMNYLPEFAEAKKLAADVLALLDGSTLEKALLRLQAELARALDLQQLIANNGFDGLDPLLKTKLAAFLDKPMAELVVEDAERVRVALGRILVRRQEFYSAALGALNHKFKFSLSESYQSTTTNQALLDVSFDFAQADDPAAMSQLLQAAIAGNFEELMLRAIPGVTLQKAKLTHGIKRQSHVEFNMPYFCANSDTLLTSDAGVMPVEEQNGRVLVYDLRSQSVASERIGNTLRRSSSLVIAGQIKAMPGTDIRVHATHTLSYSFDLRQNTVGMKTAAFRSQSAAYIQAYLNALFSGDGVSRWLTMFETQAEAGAVLGDTLLKLELSLPSSAADPWFLPEDSSEPVRLARMRRNLQSALHALIPFYYFSDLSKFGTPGPAQTLLAYQACAMAPEDLLDRERQKAELNRIAAGNDKSSLGDVLAYWAPLIRQAGFDDSFYLNTGINRRQIVESVRNNPQIFHGLLIAENEILRGAVAARRDILEFLRATRSPSEAIGALANFGGKLVSTFNENVTSIYGGGALRPLGTVIFLSAAMGLSGATDFGACSAMFDVTVLNPGVLKSANDFIDSRPAKDQIKAQERLVGRDVAPALPALPVFV